MFGSVLIFSIHFKINHPSERITSYWIPVFRRFSQEQDQNRKTVGLFSELILNAIQSIKLTADKFNSSGLVDHNSVTVIVDFQERSTNECAERFVNECVYGCAVAYVITSSASLRYAVCWNGLQFFFSFNFRYSLLVN